MSASDQAMMAKIRQTMAPFIRPAIAGSPYPESFLAALVANETSGNLSASGRFEQEVFWEISFVLIQRKTVFGSITLEKLKAYIGDSTPAATVAAIVNLATSAGPTQIMGYQSLAGGYPLAELYKLDTHFNHAIEVLEDFRKRFGIVPFDGDSWALLFRCWNTGRPDGKTFDPAYVPNGLQRMQIYG